MSNIKYVKITGSTSETDVLTGPGRLHGLVVDDTTAGTVTLKEKLGASPATIIAFSTGILEAGVNFHGVVLPAGLTITLGDATDVVLAIVEVLP